MYEESFPYLELHSTNIFKWKYGQVCNKQAQAEVFLIGIFPLTLNPPTRRPHSPSLFVLLCNGYLH